MSAAWASLLACPGSENEDAGTDDGADAEHGQLEGTQLALQRFLFGGFKNLVEWLDALEQHCVLPWGNSVMRLPEQTSSRDHNRHLPASTRYYAHLPCIKT